MFNIFTCHHPCLACILPYRHLVSMVFGTAIPTSSYRSVFILGNMEGKDSGKNTPGRVLDPAWNEVCENN